MSADLTERLNRFEAHLAELVHHIKDVRVSVRGIEERLDRVEERLGRVEERLDRVEERLDRVERGLDHVEDRLGTVEGELSAVRAWQQKTDRYLADQFQRLERRFDVTKDVVASDYLRVRIDVGELAAQQLQVCEQLDAIDKRLGRVEVKKEPPAK